jgi:phosphate-selective porin OprO/OprP
VEVAGRFGQVEFSQDAFPVYADPAASARAIRSWAVGANWWIRKAVRLSAEYDDSKFLGGAARGGRTREQVVLTRIQVML